MQHFVCMTRNKHIFAASPAESSDSRTSATAGHQSGWRRGALRRRSPPCAAECCTPAGGSRGWGSRRWRLSSCTLEKERVIDLSSSKNQEMEQFTSLQNNILKAYSEREVSSRYRHGIVTTALFLSFNLLETLILEFSILWVKIVIFFFIILFILLLGAANLLFECTLSIKIEFEKIVFLLRLHLHATPIAANTNKK